MRYYEFPFSGLSVKAVTATTKLHSNSTAAKRKPNRRSLGLNLRTSWEPSERDILQNKKREKYTVHYKNVLISLNLNESDVQQPGNQTAKAPALESASAATGPPVLFRIAKKPQKLGVQPSNMDK